MYSESLIKLALLKDKCTQKELALKLQVSPTQISKWKAGETMSSEMENRVRELTGIGERDPDVVYWTGGIEQADKWGSLILYLADFAAQRAETGYITATLTDDTEFLAWPTLWSLKGMGVKIPKEFPAEMLADFGDTDDEDEYDNKFNAFFELPLIKKIDKAFLALNDIEGFCNAYIYNLFHGVGVDELECREEIFRLDSRLLEFAFAKSGEQSELSPDFHEWSSDVIKDVRKHVDCIKKLAMHHHIPLKAELSDLIFSNSDSLGVEAEDEAFGFNNARLHPDIYMDEILRSLRLMHQVLPAICTKLGITSEELKIDKGDFTL
jgi:transcriptional regulator with XRE-family HTH domain